MVNFKKNVHMFIVTLQTHTQVEKKTPQQIQPTVYHNLYNYIN